MIASRLSLCLCLLLGAFLPAQDLVVTITPDSAPPNTNRFLTATATGAVYLPCYNMSFGVGLWSGIHNNDGARSVWPSPGLPLCSFTGANLTAGQSVTDSPPSSFLPSNPGTYWFRCPYSVGGVTKVAWVDFRVEESSPQPLITGSAPSWNSTWSLTLADPSQPGMLYGAAASFGNQNGYSLGSGLIASLDQDVLFGLTFPVSIPQFTGYGFGPLDSSGTATLFAAVPPDPGVGYQEVHVQAAVISTNGTITLSNCVDALIQ